MDKKDIKIRYTKGSGPGGQHKNKVETCVIITHLPTGLSEKCQDTRSKERNKNLALLRLEKKVKKHFDKIKLNKVNEKRKRLIQNARVVKTYNYKTNTVYDHRSKLKADLKRILNGELNLLK